MPSTLPKLSYVLLSHNREKYIRAAIESAFAQDYEGELEYIFSDDCSTDRTFEIIKECVAAYKGNRRVVVTQTPRNLHLAGNTNHAVKFATGEWVIRADDDDFSSVDRCKIAAEAIVKFPNARYIALPNAYFTADEFTDARQRSLQHNVKEIVFSESSILDGGVPPFMGGPYSYKIWHIDVYRKFPELSHSACYVDDYIAYLRALVLGSAVKVDCSALVLALKDVSSMCRGGIMTGSLYQQRVQYERFLEKYYSMSLAPLEETVRSLLKYIKVHYSQEQMAEIEPFLKFVNREIERFSQMQYYWQNNTFYRIRLMRKYFHVGFYTLLRTLPLPLFARLYSFLKKIKSIMN